MDSMLVSLHATLINCSFLHQFLASTRTAERNGVCASLLKLVAMPRQISIHHALQTKCVASSLINHRGEKDVTNSTES